MAGASGNRQARATRVRSAARGRSAAAASHARGKGIGEASARADARFVQVASPVATLGRAKPARATASSTPAEQRRIGAQRGSAGSGVPASARTLSSVETLPRPDVARRGPMAGARAKRSGDAEAEPAGPIVNVSHLQSVMAVRADRTPAAAGRSASSTGVRAARPARRAGTSESAGAAALTSASTAGAAVDPRAAGPAPLGHPARTTYALASERSAPALSVVPGTGASARHASSRARRPPTSRVDRLRSAVGAVVERIASRAAPHRRVLTVALATLVIIAFVYPPARDWYVAQRANQGLQERYDVIAAENDDLEQDLGRLQSRDGIEDEARRRGYVMPGETSVVLEGLDADTGEGAGGEARTLLDEVGAVGMRALDLLFGYRPA